VVYPCALKVIKDFSVSYSDCTPDQELFMEGIEGIALKNLQWPVTFTAGFYQFSCHVARDLEGFGNGSALSYESRQILRSRDVDALG